MRFWLAPRSEVPIREQLVTQVVLGILGDELRPGQRLPSTRELARRFQVHANTISGAYRQLEKERWLEFRRGSGVYVRRNRPQKPLAPSLALDQLIAGLFRAARESGLPLAAVRSRLRQCLTVQPPDHFLLLEPDEELRRIVLAELREALTFPVAACGFDECGQPETLAGAVPLVLPSKVERTRQELPAGAEFLALRVRSVPASLAPWLAVKRDLLIGVASRWEDFLRQARTMLVAAGFAPDGLVFRDARQRGWEKGLRETAAVVCDSLTAKQLPKGCLAIPFPLLAESSLAELQRYQEFITRPLA